MIHRIRKAIFPIGGLGTRLLPATKAVPKELFPIIDKPLIQYAVEEAFASGIEQIICVIPPDDTAIAMYFDSSEELKAILRDRGKVEQLRIVESITPAPGRITYTPQPKPLGLGHAVWCAREFIDGEHFAVILPDDLILSQTPCLKQMIEAYEPNMQAMVGVIEIPDSKIEKYGVLDVTRREGNCVFSRGMVEKPAVSQAPSSFAAVGRYILTPSVMKALDSQEKGVGGEIQLTDAIASCVQEDNLCGYLFEGTRYDCGSKEGLVAATLDVALSRDDLKDVLDRAYS